MATRPTPAARLALATALERAGREDDALRALWPARDDPDVRAALATFPAYDHGPLGGSACFIDTPPLTTRPRIRWRTSLVPADPGAVVGLHRTVIAASPIAIVTTGRDERGLVGLDPDTGELRWQTGPRPGAHRHERLRIVGESIVVPEGPDEVARDLWTGANRSGVTAPIEPTLAEAFARAPAFEVVSREQLPQNCLRIVVVDRGSGADRAVIADGVYDMGAVAVARHVVFHFTWQLSPAYIAWWEASHGGITDDDAPGPFGTSSLLVATDASNGRELWRVSEAELGTGLLALAPLAGRLYALGQDASVICLEADA